MDLFSISEKIEQKQFQEQSVVKANITIENETINKNEVLIEKEETNVLEANISDENTRNTKNTITEDNTQETQIKEENVIMEKPPPNNEIQNENKNTQIVVIEEQAKEGEVVNNPEVDRYINILRDWGSYYDVFPISENSDKYILCRTNTRVPTPLTNILPVITKKITYIRRRRRNEV